MSLVEVYDTLGQTYSVTRRPDTRIAAQLGHAIGAGSVINVGAGAGSYEPATTRLAIEPSAVMIAQRPEGAAPCFQANAEALPVDDNAYDVALAVLTIHHWADLEQGLRELERVARRVVILTWDVALADRFWLFRDYLPESVAYDQARFAPIEALAERLHARVEIVPVPHDCTDGFAGAYWRRPHAYLDAGVRAGMSNFAHLGDDVLPALARLEGDLASGAWHERNRAIGDPEELDLGYRIIASR